MIHDVSLLASILREDSLAASIERRRDEIIRGLQQEGTFTIREGGREFTFSTARAAEAPVRPPK